MIRHGTPRRGGRPAIPTLERVKAGRKAPNPSTKVDDHHLKNRFFISHHQT
jgi:hypothetical protein